MSFRFIYLIVLAFLVSTNLPAQQGKMVNYVAPRTSATKIKWYTFEEVQALNKTEKKKVFVDLYTDWCGWCKVMDKNTFADPDVIKYVNENYYPIKFNAESKESIKYLDKEYNYIANGNRGYNELALKLSQGQLSFPTVVFLDENLNIIQPIPGYQESDNFLMIAKYFAENKYKDTPWSVYQKQYRNQ